MNTDSKIKKSRTILLLLALLTLAPLQQIAAQSSNSEFGIWGTIEASKKITKKFNIDFEAELRSTDFVNKFERVSLGIGANYKFTKWLKASAGYIFIYNNIPDTKKIKYEDALEFEGTNYYDYNIDHAYRTERHRLHLSLAGDWKIGRVELSLRERVQYTRTNSATTDETKYLWQQNEIYDEETQDFIKQPPTLFTETAPEFKEAKQNTTLRSRLSIKWDIPKCKVNPFASVELYTRLDQWKFHDKLRYRLGASYKINKDNKISLFYLYQDTNDNDEPKGHAVGIGYSIDL